MNPFNDTLHLLVNICPYYHMLFMSGNREEWQFVVLPSDIEEVGQRKVDTRQGRCNEGFNAEPITFAFAFCILHFCNFRIG